MVPPRYGRRAKPVVSEVHQLNSRDEVFAKLARLPLKYFDRTPAGETISRTTNDIEAINDGLANAIVQLVSGSASVLLALGFMISLNIKVALVAVFVTPLCFFTGFIITRYGKSKFSTTHAVYIK